MARNNDSEYGSFQKSRPVTVFERNRTTEQWFCSVGKGEAVPDDELPAVLFRLPNTAFGISMGIAGHAIMWKTLVRAPFVTERKLFVESVYVMNVTCWYLAFVTAVLFVVCYAYKTIISLPLVKAEWADSVRVHFFNGPNLIFMMLLLGLPPGMEIPSETVRILWVFAFCYHLMITQQIYKALMFAETGNFSDAKPQFLLSTVGWFLLSNLGFSCKIPDDWGIGLPQMCLGAGLILYMDVLIFIFTELHCSVDIKGSPAMFLLMAPPAVGVVGLGLSNKLDGGDSIASSEMLLGWVLVLELLLIRMASNLWTQPSVLGEYWAYVFPVAASSTATIWYAMEMNTVSTKVLALIMIVMAFLSLLLVLGRSLFHASLAVGHQEVWRDPLFRTEHYSESGLSIRWTSFRSRA